MVIAGFFSEKAYTAANEVNKKGVISFPIQADLANIKSIKNMVKEMMEHCGEIKILLNNAVPIGLYAL